MAIPVLKGQHVQVVLFDLDDTLYPEAEYVRSGFRAVSEAFATSTVSQQELLSWMNELFAADRAHVLDSVARRLVTRGIHADRGEGTVESLAGQMIACYREHVPTIHLYPDAAECLEVLRASRVPMGLVTDGIGSVQEKKVQALGIAGFMDVIIYTDRLAPNRQHWKPSSRGFEMAARHFRVSPSQCCYVADNPVKDFAGPARIGMPSIWVRRADGIYRDVSNAESADVTQTKQNHDVPTCRLTDLRRLPELLGLE